MTTIVEASVRPLIPEEIARVVISPKSYTDDDVIYPALAWLRQNMPLGVAEVEGYHHSSRRSSIRFRYLYGFGNAPVAELLASDCLVIVTPLWNFGISAAIKAWIDLVVRAGKTFQYTAEGVTGLAQGKRAYVLGGFSVRGPGRNGIAQCPITPRCYWRPKWQKSVQRPGLLQ